VVVVVVVVATTPNYLRQASQNLGKYKLIYWVFPVHLKLHVLFYHVSRCLQST